MYIAECPEVGTVSQGETIELSLSNLKEATELYLEDFPLEDVPHPPIPPALPRATQSRSPCTQDSVSTASS